MVCILGYRRISERKSSTSNYGDRLATEYFFEISIDIYISTYIIRNHENTVEMFH